MSLKSGPNFNPFSPGYNGRGQQNNMHTHNETTCLHTTKQHVYKQQNNTYTHNKTTRIHTTKQHARTQKITVPANIS